MAEKNLIIKYGTESIYIGNLLDELRLRTLNTYALYNLSFYISFISTIAFNKLSGTGGTDLINAIYEQLLPTITPPTRTGHTFGGYYTSTSGSGTKYYNADGTSSKVCDFVDDITLYAKWTASTYTLTASVSGGNGSISPVSATVNYGGSLIFTLTPNTGYMVNLVTVDGTIVTVTNNTFTVSSVASNKTIVATFKAITYTITYEDQGGRTFSGTHASGYPTTHTYGTSTTLKTASKTGYTFDGWFTNSSCTGTAVTSLGATSYTSNITLYAKWTALTYTITYNANGGSGAPAAQTKTYDVTLTLSSTIPTLTGKSFAGWAESSTATLALYNAGSSFTKNADTTLYAVWTDAPSGQFLTATANGNGSASISFTLLTTTKPTVYIVGATNNLSGSSKMIADVFCDGTNSKVTYISSTNFNGLTTGVSTSMSGSTFTVTVSGCVFLSGVTYKLEYYTGTPTVVTKSGTASSGLNNISFTGLTEEPDVFVLNCQCTSNQSFSSTSYYRHLYVIFHKGDSHGYGILTGGSAIYDNSTVYTYTYTNSTLRITANNYSGKTVYMHQGSGITQELMCLNGGDTPGPTTNIPVTITGVTGSTSNMYAKINGVTQVAPGSYQSPEGEEIEIGFGGGSYFGAATLKINGTTVGSYTDSSLHTYNYTPARGVSSVTINFAYGSSYGSTPANVTITESSSPGPTPTEDYTMLQYIQNTATHSGSATTGYLNTGYKPTSTTSMTLEAQLDEKFAYARVFSFGGYYHGETSNSTTTNKVEIKSNGRTATSAGTSTVDLSTNKFTMTITNLSTLKFNGTQFSPSSSSVMTTQNDANATIEIFNNSVGQYKNLNNPKGKIYSCIISEGSTEKLHLVAAKRNSDNKVGMLDTLTNTFYVPSGNSWAAGPTV